MSPDDVYQIRIGHRSRALGDGFLVDPRFVVTTAEVLRDAGPVFELRVPDADGPTPSDTTPSDDGTNSASTAGPGGTALIGTGPSGAGPSDDGPSDDGPGGTVAAEVVEVLGEDGPVLLAVLGPGFRTLPDSAVARPGAALDRPGRDPLLARDLRDWLARFRRLGARHLRAELDGPPTAEAGAGATAEAGAGAGVSGPGGDDRGALLLDHLRERARHVRLDPVLTVPELDAGEGSR